ncbi:zinc finger BED domain-containing protein RICESLEEPER 2-like protein, partial [Tanacetum coccineum]
LAKLIFAIPYFSNTYKRAFDRLAIEDFAYRSGFEDRHKMPSSFDWDNVKRLVGFLQHYYQLILRVSGTKNITSNTFLDSISSIHTVTMDSISGEDDEVRKISLGVKKKFDQYLSEINKLNLLVFIASLFDPRKKFTYLHVTICNMYGDDDGGKLVASCRNALYELFDEYKRIHFDQNVSNISSSSDHGLSSTSYDAKSELDRYLTEDIEDDNEYFQSKDFSVLDWWKKRSTTFPILSLVARDVLAMPISTVACESSFSTKGKVLDSFRTLLPSETIQALVCCEDWFRTGDVPINVEKHIQELDKYEYDMRETLSESSDV